MVTILSFIVVIGVIIFVHELGHFLAARSVGIRVEIFSLGYPPKMIGKKVGETEYRIGLIPLGGYVKMAGMIDESLDGESTLTGAPWEFQSKNALEKLWVVIAGVVMNFVLAIVLYTGIAAFKGIPEPGPYVGGLTPDGPAQMAGLQEGDRILSIDGVAVETWADLIALVRPRPDEPLRIVYEREGLAQEVALTAGHMDVEIDGAQQDVGLIGIVVSQKVVYSPAARGKALIWGFQATGRTIQGVARAVWMLVSGQASVRDLGGPMLIAKMSGDSAREGLGNFLFFLAFISINIGCLNLLPVPALDGGHGVIILAEAFARREIPNRVKMAIQQTGMILLLALILFILWNDADRLFGFEWVKRIF